MSANQQEKTNTTENEEKYKQAFYRWETSKLTSIWRGAQTPLGMQEMQIKITIKYPLTCMRSVKIREMA